MNGVSDLKSEDPRLNLGLVIPETYQVGVVISFVWHLTLRGLENKEM